MIVVAILLSCCCYSCGSTPLSGSDDEKATEDSASASISTSKISEPNEVLTTDDIGKGTDSLTETLTEESTKTETTEAKQELFEKNEKVVNLLKTGFSFETMGTPTINFVPETNTYVVIVPTDTNEIGSEFDKANGNETWDNFVESFTELTNEIINTISWVKGNESINFRVIHTLKTPVPLIAIENGKVVFNLYKSEPSDRALYTLRVQCDLHQEFCSASIEYDDSNNSYMLTFRDSINHFKIEEYAAAFIETNNAFKGIIKSYDNPDVIFNIVENDTENPFYTIINGEVTYSALN